MGCTRKRRYQRRTTRVDEAILGVYLAGGNTRRIKGALAPLLRGGPLSEDAVSRLIGRLREDYRRMIYADSVSAVEHERARFTKKWQLRCPAVVDSLKEAGDEL